MPGANRNKKLLNRLTVGSAMVAAAIPAQLIFSQYQHDMSLAHRRILSSGKIIETAYGPIEYTDFVFWSMVRLSPKGLLAALGVPLAVQKQLSREEVAELDAFLESMVPMGARRNGQNLEQHMSEYDAEQIKNIQAPALILHARDDTLVSFEQGEFTARNVPGAQFIPMEKGGHLALMLNCNSGAKEKVREFLNE